MKSQITTSKADHGHRGNAKENVSYPHRRSHSGIRRTPKNVAKKTSRQVEIASDQIEPLVHVVRGQRVMLDSDLAQLYGVPTKRLNEQVARNPDRFPEDFAYQLTPQEVAHLKSQIATSSLGHGGATTPQTILQNFRFCSRLPSREPAFGPSMARASGGSQDARKVIA